MIQKYSLFVIGGLEKIKIFVLVVYICEEGLLSNDNMGKYVMWLNVDQEIFLWVKIGFILNLIYIDRN